ncbi:putative casparian strip membrane protein [Medicago truncatula]|uniref:CASP-like protein n=1 Tax=Medicago truncatula TaxID=3880 RepID=A0A072TJ77_MEDTR|nr:CASP-like protein 1C1 [Medicago truncatula]KEH17619.1 CASP POPTRDRAFT-like protein [Medicago truncatula]RHN60062.1 putative casparian strip membrane protein [Medicago truncatula]
MAKTGRICHLLLRFLAFSATLSAVVVMVSSHEKASFFTVSFEAKYTNSPAFKYFVIANSIVTVYGFFVLFLPAESLLWRLVVAMDMVLTMLLISSISAALAIAQVAKNGNNYAAWLPICGSVPKFCNHMTGALVASFIGVIIYLILLLHSIHTVLDPLLLRKT